MPSARVAGTEWRAQVHTRGSPEYRVRAILDSVAGVPVRLHEVLWGGCVGETVRERGDSHRKFSATRINSSSRPEEEIDKGTTVYEKASKITINKYKQL